MQNEYRYFREHEFKCPCCGVAKIYDEFLRKLEVAREQAKTPFRITSGYRCPKHNGKIGGKYTSSHMKGLAADISATSSRERFMILSSLISAGFTRIGIRKDFIHVDADDSKSERVAWLY